MHGAIEILAIIEQARSEDAQVLADFGETRVSHAISLLEGRITCKHDTELTIHDQEEAERIIQAAFSKRTTKEVPFCS